MSACREEKGAVTIVEATLVFPIVFFVVFFMIMAGEAYYQFARVEYAVTSAAISGAARCENPMMKELLERGSLPTDPTEPDVMPYRYIFDGEAQRIGDDLETDLENRISSFRPLLFRGMSPQNVVVEATPHMNILVSSQPVVCTFDVPFPIRMIFSGDSLKMKYTVQMTAPVGDPSEFVRNVAMVGDLIERSEKATAFAGKAKEAMETIGSYTN